LFFNAYYNLSDNRTTSQISGYTAKVNSSAVDSYTYSYDNLGNITVINRSGNLPISYTYDAQNQLIRVVEGVYRYEYTYDTYGNILTVKYYDDDIEELISSNTYSYTNSQWVDQLTTFNGQSITYDEIGNPLSYYNGSRYTFTWNGRELATAVKGSTSISYKYGADGLRTQKTVGSTVYNYYYADGLLIRQTWGTNYMDFLYDESGSAYSFIYNGTQYYYVKNLQGDVMRIVNTSGTVVANYFYDAWGKVTNSGNIVGLYNPIRYRGYYYDTDTGFYYLQSRYYDPAIKRFISADDTDNLGANGDFTSLNLYAYCGNNPVAREDEAGEFWLTSVLIAAAVGGVISAIADASVQYLTTGNVDLGQTAIAAVSGAISGACALIPGGPVTSTVLSGVINAGLNSGSYALNQYRKGEDVDLKDLGKNAGIGFVSGVVGNVFRLKSTSAMREGAQKLIDKGTTKLMNGVANSSQSTVKRAFQYWDRGISMMYRYAYRAGTNSGFGSAVGTIISGLAG